MGLTLHQVLPEPGLTRSPRPFKVSECPPATNRLTSYEVFFCLEGWTYLTTIALAAFSTPALIVAVSTRLEPRGGLCIHQLYYNKSCPSRAGLVSH